MRPADWSAAGFGSDPIPGDPDTVRHGGHSYLDIARTIDTTVRGLRTLDLESTVSEAIDALGETARTVADDIAKAEARYRATGNALVSYAAALADAQDASVTALQRAQSAQDAASDAQTERRRYLHLSESAADPADALRYETLADDAGRDARHASGTANAAHQDILDAARRRDVAAQSARDEIENTTSGDQLGDSWWDDWGKDVLSVITDVAGTIAGIAGILALVVSWIPVIGQALAAALLLVAGIAAVINAIGNIVLASTGDRSWGEAIISIIGAALSVVGIGGALRAVTGLSRGAFAAAGRSMASGARSAASRVATGASRVRNLGARARINALARQQSGWNGEKLTVMEALRLEPQTLAKSERLWNTPVAAPHDGDAAFRLWGGGSGSGGGSWSGVDPTTMSSTREMLGLPNVNTMDNLSLGVITDASQVQHVRHALPLDGMPGGGAEWVFRGGDPLDFAVGRVTLVDVPFAVRP